MIPKTEYVMVDTATIPHPAEKHKKKFLVFGIIQVVAAIICIGIGVFGAVQGVKGIELQGMRSKPIDSIGIGEEYDYYVPEYYEPKPNPYEYFTLSPSIIAGIMFLISGILGIVSGGKPTNCNVIGALVMTIFSALCAFDVVIYQLAGIYRFPNGYSEEFARLDALHYTLMGISALIFIVSIIHSCFSCCSTCCAKRQRIMLPFSHTPEYTEDGPPDYHDMEKKLIEA